MPTGPLPIVPVPAGSLDGTWRVPGSKSITNRALVLAALAAGETELTNVLAADDTRHMQVALAQLGIGISDLGSGRLRIAGGRSRLRAPAAPLFCGNSGTTIRFLAALAALVPGPVTLTGDAHMAKRPIADLVDGLRQLGLRVDCATGCPPLTVHGGRFPGGTVRLRGDRSSQYLTALLLVAGQGEADLDVVIEGDLVSRPYVEMTCQVAARFGLHAASSATGYRAMRGVARATAFAIEPDASSASYPFALAAAGGHRIAVPDLGTDSLQGDYAFVDVLERAGARVERSRDRTVVQGSGRLTGIDVNMKHISDTVMSLAAIAPLAHGRTAIRDVANIRIKETDRLAAVVAELQRLGQRVEHGADWLAIDPCAVTPATVQCYSDHRMAMSFAVLGCCAPGIVIADPDCTAKTYPGFWSDLRLVAGA